MLIADKPYISDYLCKTLEQFGYPVADTQTARELLNSDKINFLSEKDFINLYKSKETPLLYTNSENAIAWIEDKLSFSDIPDKIRLFKNKAGLRDVLKPMYPNYFYTKIKYEELEQTDYKNLKYPFIIKPVVGFFSLGVRKIEKPEEYLHSIEEIKDDMLLAEKLYPKEVIENTEFIIEQVIDGEEFAIDFYYDNNGKPVILNITKHLFASGKDMSDRAYISSKTVIEEHLDLFSDFLKNMGNLINIKNFPAHAEVRKTAEGEVIPIEVNPLRFGGWCTTADLAQYSLNINLYQYFFEQKVPDWQKILQGKEGKVFSMIILDNSTGIAAEKIKSFDYEKLLTKFEKPLELRTIDYRKFPIFAFLFAETSADNMQEINYILKSRLREFIEV